MPFTLAHPAVVLPLRRSGLPMSALVAGSMAPDARLFVPWLGSYDASHSALGVVTLDPVLALGLLALWTWVVRDVLVDLSPAPVRERLAARARLTSRQWALALPAAAVGSATHVGWDAFTHHDRWGYRHVAWLRDEHLFWPGYTWAQATSGVLGLAVVGAVALVWLRSRPRTPRTERPLLPRPTLVLVASAVAAAGGAAGVGRLPVGLEGAAYHWVVTTLRLAAVATAVACAVWWLLRATRVARPSLEP